MSMTECQIALVRYGIEMLTRQLRQPLPTPDSLGPLGNELRKLPGAEPTSVQKARELLGDSSVHPGGPPPGALEDLVSIFSLVEWGHEEPAQRYPLLPLSFGETHPVPGDECESEQSISPEDLHRKFLNVVRQIPTGGGMFETFCSVVNVYGWKIPSSLSRNYSRQFDPVGISLFEQFKAVAALAHCLEQQGGSTDLLLVGGDIPGIQSMLYTITSRGVAKSLRGRSVYLQLLGDAVLRSLLVRLQLPWANVVYNAGGNFKVLVPASAENAVSTFRDEMNADMLKLHGGELYIALAWAPIPAAAIIDNVPYREGGELARATQRLAEALDQEKAGWFARLVMSDSDAHYCTVFGPFGRGGPISSGGEWGTLCQVCHADVTEKTREKVNAATYCAQCASFEKLARHIADARYLLVESIPKPNSPTEGPGSQKPWKEALTALGFDYTFLADRPDLSGAEVRGRMWLYQLNGATDFIGPTANVAYGVRALANLTPRMHSEDGQDVIRDFETMAEKDATGIRRYGVLRMDVDDLGSVFGTKLRFHDLLHTSALSAAISLFFEGHLGPLCRAATGKWKSQTQRWTRPPTSQTDEDPDTKVPYVIYAGGDDLFIVGCWDVLLEVARAVREAFGHYTHGRLTLSAGIALGHKKFPLYQAGELAGAALKQAKRRHRRNQEVGTREKDALTFLGVPLGWEEFAPVRECALTLVRLLKGDGGITPTAPKALLGVLGEAAAAYRKERSARGSSASDLEDGEPEGVLLGQWFWRLTYGLNRMAARVDPGLRDDILALNYGPAEEGVPHTGTVWRIIGHLGLAVRWAEFLTRKEEAHHGSTG